MAYPPSRSGLDKTTPGTDVSVAGDVPFERVKTMARTSDINLFTESFGKTSRLMSMQITNIQIRSCPFDSLNVQSGRLANLVQRRTPKFYWKLHPILKNSSLGLNRGRGRRVSCAISFRHVYYSTIEVRRRSTADKTNKLKRRENCTGRENEI